MQIPLYLWLRIDATPRGPGKVDSVGDRGLDLARVGKAGSTPTAGPPCPLQPPFISLTFPMQVREIGTDRM